MIKWFRLFSNVFILILMLTCGTFRTVVNASEHEEGKATGKSGSIEERFSHFVLKKGEKILFVEPYISLSEILLGQSENQQYRDYRGAKFSAMELLHPLAIMINKTSPKSAECMAETLTKKLDSKNSLLNEILLTATEFYSAMEKRATYTPPSVGQVALHGAAMAAEALTTSTLKPYSDALRAKLEVTFKQVYEKHKLDIDRGAIEKVRQELFEKTLSTLNEYMETFYDPQEFIFKGLIMGGHAKGDLLKYLDNIAKKALPPFITENGHAKGSVGVILHSPRKVTTVSTFDTREVLNEQTVVTITPALWLTARLKQNQNSRIKTAGTNNSPDKKTTTAKENPASTQPDSVTSPLADGTNSPKLGDTAEFKKTTSNFVSPADSLYWTAGSIWGEREIDIANLESYEGLFFELNVFILGFTVNINQAFFFKEILRPSKPSASAISFSVEHNGFKSIRREELKNNIGKIKFLPNGGYLNVFPIKNYSMDISTLN
jgi:hypothetical protein